MNTWTPIFSKIVDSSLWAEPDYVCKVFITMLALKDADQVVRFNAYAIGRKCWPTEANAEAQALKALRALSSPDKRRLEPQPYGGRRIEKVEDGWLILNGQFYEDMMRNLNRKAYKARWQAAHRMKEKAKKLPGEQEYVRAAENGASEGELNEIVEKNLRGGGGEPNYDPR